jgi:hypothetical protein
MSSLICLGEASSAITRCCGILGEARTARILAEIDSVRDELLNVSRRYMHTSGGCDA